jgi:arginine decarboxylase
MKNKYIDLIKQTFDFPQEVFDVVDDELYFNGISLMEIIKKYGTPLKIFYLPKISEQIKKARTLFNVAMAKCDYKGTYNYCYCTKSSHFSFVLEEILRNDSNIETSSAFDLNIMEVLSENGQLKKDTYIVCNGFKRPQYVENIIKFINNGFLNLIPVLDNKLEIDQYIGEIKIKQNWVLGLPLKKNQNSSFTLHVWE